MPNLADFVILNLRRITLHLRTFTFALVFSCLDHDLVLTGKDCDQCWHAISSSFLRHDCFAILSLSPSVAPLSPVLLDGCWGRCCCGTQWGCCFVKAGQHHSLLPSPCASSVPQEVDESGPYASDSVSPGISSFSYVSEQVLDPRMHKKHLLGQTRRREMLF